MAWHIQSFVADLSHPVHHFTVEVFLNGAVRHGRGRRGAVPMLFTRRKPDNVANFLTADQGGYPCQAGAHVDIGAVERIYLAAGPGTLTNVTRLANASIQFGFTNFTDANFPVLATTKLVRL